jgi:hypothetical protein
MYIYVRKITAILGDHGEPSRHWIILIYTVTRTTQNEALLLKITDLGIEKAFCWCRNILYLAHTGI